MESHTNQITFHESRTPAASENYPPPLTLRTQPPLNYLISTQGYASSAHLPTLRTRARLEHCLSLQHQLFLLLLQLLELEGHLGIILGLRRGPPECCLLGFGFGRWHFRRKGRKGLTDDGLELGFSVVKGDGQGDVPVAGGRDPCFLLVPKLFELLF